MRLRLKIDLLSSTGPTDQLTLKECLGTLARARSHVSYVLSETIEAAGPEPDDAALKDIDAQFKLLALVMLLRGDIEAVLRAK